ncbi:MFS transporter [Marihabitans asiaticum]|uniref:Putative MFS family arabinose efflux permease n=1 Tax=Marihabitans asiaticum TaxID=415218 RepID=A0A560WHP0_9MICO|nr:MFS transporter [Marihabitans asiaticum]TWD17086.1 putative MFS family arabinose efflux permease [Marihabitans asiaticum]
MSAPPFAWRQIALPAYGPVIGNGTAIGAVLPVAALRAHEQLGASLAAAGLVVALIGVGQLIGALPAGVLVARVGERRALVLAGVVDVVALAVAGFVPSLVVMGAALCVAGLASSVYFLARQGFMIDLLPADRLARGMSLLGGALRLGMLLGPALGGVAVSLVGLQGAFVVAIAGAATSLTIVALTPDITASRDRAMGAAAAGEQGLGSLVRVLRRHARTLLTVGGAVVIMSALRQARVVILPLWAAHLGLGGVESSTAFAVAGALELLLVYPAGWVMDQVGRAAVATPMTVLLAVTIAALPLADGFGGLVAVASAMAVANGLGAGIVMTLGADNAPDAGRSEFLGGWRFCGEVGHAGGSLAVAVLTALVSLTTTALAIGVVGLLGAGWVGWWTLRSDRAAAKGGLSGRDVAQSSS